MGAPTGRGGAADALITTPSLSISAMSIPCDKPRLLRSTYTAAAVAAFTPHSSDSRAGAPRNASAIVSKATVVRGVRSAMSASRSECATRPGRSTGNIASSALAASSAAYCVCALRPVRLEHSPQRVMRQPRSLRRNGAAYERTVRKRDARLSRLPRTICVDRWRTGMVHRARTTSAASLP